MQRVSERGREVQSPLQGKIKGTAKVLKISVIILPVLSPRTLTHFFSTPHRVNAKAFHSKDGTNKKLLKYNEVTHCLFCSVCLAFTKPSSSYSAFIKGGTQAWKYAHQIIQEQERTKAHRESFPQSQQSRHPCHSE